MNVLAYLGVRMREASSWGGAAVFVLGALHWSASPDLVNAVIGVVVAIGGVIGVLVPENGAASSPNAAQSSGGSTGHALLLALVLCAVGLTACAGLTTAVAKFEHKAAPVVARACTVFHAAEANPLVQIGIAAGSAAASAATGGVAGPVIASLRSFGDGFCADGPPAGDATTPEQQAQWVIDIAAKMLAAAEAPAPAK